MHGGRLNFSYGRHLGILLRNLGKLWFPSFLFRLIVQIQGYGGGEVGHCGGKVFMFSFCVSLVLVYLPKSIKRATGQKGWELMYIFLLKKLECTWLELF